jgi:hypothetical protein
MSEWTHWSVLMPLNRHQAELLGFYLDEVRGEAIERDLGAQAADLLRECGLEAAPVVPGTALSAMIRAQRGLCRPAGMKPAPCRFPFLC